MKNIWKTLAITLLVILIAISGFAGFMFWRLTDTIHSIASDYQVSENVPIEISDESTLTSFYQTLVSQLREYGDLNESEQASADLMTQIFVKTMKDCTVRSVEYEEDKIIINVQGVAVPMDQINAALIAGAAGKAALSYLGHDFLNAAGSLFQGEEAMKKVLYGGYVNELLVTLKDDIKNKEVEPVFYQIAIRLQEGKWIIESVETQVSDEELNSVRQLTDSELASQSQVDS